MSGKRRTHATQEPVHKLVELFGGQKVPTLEYTHSQAWNDGQMLAQSGLDYCAKAVVVFDGFDLWDLAEGLEGLVVELVDVREMAVRHDHVRELLHVADAMGEAHRELGAHIVCRVDDALVVKITAAKEDELDEMDEPGAGAVSGKGTKLHT